MQYPRILNLIDAYLGRLTEARQVLLELDRVSKNGQKSGSPAVVNKRALKAVAKERQTRLAFAITLSQPEAPRQKPKSNIDKRAGKRIAEASLEIQAGPFVQSELFSQERQHDPSRKEQRTDANGEKPLPAIEPIPVSVKVRAQRKPTTRNRAASAPAARALGGTVSAAPVFIPAERVRQEHLQKATNKDTKDETSRSAIAAPLTVEMLTQRWVQGLTS